jgi:hypothetical protein
MRSKFNFCKRSFCLLGCILIFIYLISIISNKENFSNYNSANSFCKSNTGNKLNDKCKNLTFTNCNNTDCCIYEKNASCMAGNRDGALFNTDQNGKTKKITYYFKNICYGC